VRLGERPDPVPAAGQALVRVRGAGVGPWDVGFLGGGFPGIDLPFVPGQEIAGVVEAAGQGADVQPGQRVYGTLFPAGGGFAELALASADRLAPMLRPQVEAVFPLDQAREALARVAGRHTRGKIVLRIGQ
jgi:NADPH2:quinone reductase